MAPPKGSANGKAAWVGQFEPAPEPKVKIDSKVPKSIAQKFLEVLKPGESKSASSSESDRTVHQAKRSRNQLEISFQKLESFDRTRSKLFLFARATRQARPGARHNR